MLCSSISSTARYLALLQEDARLTNSDLSERVNLSPSQCSRRRQRLEEEGLIRGYRAVLDRDRLGFSLVNIVSVTLATHNRDNARRFAELLARLPEVQEAHALTGEMDYIAEGGDARPALAGGVRQRRAAAARIGAACEDRDRAGDAEGNQHAAAVSPVRGALQLRPVAIMNRLVQRAPERQ